MSQADAVSFLEKSKYYLERHLQELDVALDQVRNAPDDGAAAAIMAGEVARAMTFHDSEVTALQGWANSTPVTRRPPPVLPRPAVTPQAVAPQAQQQQQPQLGRSGNSSPSKRIDPSRLMAMGAVPTLGGILRVPASKEHLTATASPAARELLRRRLNRGEGAHVISSVGSGGSGVDPYATEPGAGLADFAAAQQPSSPSWQEELRARRLNPTPSRVGPRPPAAADATVNDELAALFAKRQSIT